MRMILSHAARKAALVFFAAALTRLPLGANAHISTQSHQSEVTDAAYARDGSFFTAGKDGFIIKWTGDGLGEHYQLTELEIRLIAVHPNGNDIAVYETDGYSVHRVSVWNWRTLSRRFVRTLASPITALSFTARGSLLAAGTASVSGAVYLNPTTGRTVQKIRESTGIVSMIVGSASEKSAVMYSPAGHLSYYNMTNGTRKQRFQTEQQLEQVHMFNNNLFMAGVRNNQIYIIDALSGATAACIAASSPVILGDPDGTSLYYTEASGRAYNLKSIAAAHTEQGTTAVDKPVLVKAFTATAQANGISCGAKSNGRIVLGAKSGGIYEAEIASLADALPPLTDNMYDRVLDIASIGSDFYCLTPKAVHRTSYDTGVVDTVGQNSGFTDILSYGDKLVLWAKGTRGTVSVMDLQTRTVTPLFRPDGHIQLLRLFGDKLVFIEGNTSVKLHDIATGRTSELYSGTGIQDAVLYNDTELFVAKSAASNPRSPLINVNTDTKETVMLPVSGNVAFSLSYSGTGNMIYGIQVSSDGENAATSVFSYNPAQKRTLSVMQRLKEEDTDAFLTQSGGTLYTNIGKDQIRTYDTKTRRQTQMDRSASLPLKLERAGNRIAVLNRDGSISWYTAGNGTVLADWYMTVDGMWFEF